MKQKNTSTNGGKDEETYKSSALHEEEKIDKEISVKGTESLTGEERETGRRYGSFERCESAEDLRG